jgi:putative ABC transport system substrate-binding protein
MSRIITLTGAGGQGDSIDVRREAKGVREKMNKKVISVVLGAMLSVLSFPAKAQQAGKIPRIGFLYAVSPSSVSDRVEAFRQGLRDLGYVEGKTLLLSIDMQREN